MTQQTVLVITIHGKIEVPAYEICGDWAITPNILPSLKPCSLFDTITHISSGFKVHSIFPANRRRETRKVLRALAKDVKEDAEGSYSPESRVRYQEILNASHAIRTRP